MNPSISLVQSAALGPRFLTLAAIIDACTGTVAPWVSALYCTALSPICACLRLTTLNPGSSEKVSLLQAVSCLVSCSRMLILSIISFVLSPAVLKCYLYYCSHALAQI